MVEAKRPFPRVVIIGAGFGGLQCARKLAKRSADVVLVDRHNYHLFTPLLYQVASCLLGPSEITAPLREVFRGVSNVRVRMGDVTHVDFEHQTVHLADGDELAYDVVVLATGSRTSYFGNDGLAEHTLGLKELGEALQLRNHVLTCLERATATTDAAIRRQLLTFCIVGGGPTGVEYAGALAELVRLVLPGEYPEIAPHEVRIVLLEGSDRLLAMLPSRLSEYARRELVHLGVEVRLHALVADATADEVRTRDGDKIATASMIWTAGVQPSAPGGALHGRIDVDERLRIRGVANAFAIGDAANVKDRRGTPLPMTSAPAMQAGRYVAKQILDPTRSRRFRYRDKGTMATVGRSAAAAKLGPLRLTGFIGWVTWLLVHLYYLIGFENRLVVMMRWGWYYVRYDRPIRSIIEVNRRFE